MAVGRRRGHAVAAGDHLLEILLPATSTTGCPRDAQIPMASFYLFCNFIVTMPMTREEGRCRRGALLLLRQAWTLLGDLDLVGDVRCRYRRCGRRLLILSVGIGSFSHFKCILTATIL